MAAPVLQFKRGAYSSLPGLRPGEPAFTTDLFDLYIGFDSSTENNKFFGSHRYWKRETASTGSGVNLLESTGIGTEFITLAAPSNVGTAITYYLPATNGPAGTLLTNDGTGVLSWDTAITSPQFSGIATFTDTTDNTLGDVDTGSIQIDGGVGIAKNVTIGGNLNVQGYSEFVGVATFKGGTINLGDANTDDINVAGEFISNLVPNATNTYDLGTSSQSWKDLYLDGTTFTEQLSVTGVSTLGSDVNANANLIVSGNTSTETLNVSGVSTYNDRLNISGDVDVTGNLAVSGVSTFSGLASFVGVGTTTYIGGDIITGNFDASGIATFRSFVTVSGTIESQGGDSRFASASITDLTEGRVVIVGSSGSLDDTSNLTYSASGGLLVGAGGLNVTGITTFSSIVDIGAEVKIGGNAIKASDGNTNITLTSNTLTSFAGDIKVEGANIQDAGGATAITLSGSQNVEIGGDLTIGGNDILASDGTTSISLSDSTGNVQTFADLTVSGNLYVNGSTTQVNTTTLTVEDTLIEFGLVDGSAPSSDLNKDIGLILNYYTDSAKKAAVYWDDSESRIVLSEDVNESSSVLSSSAYAALEIGSLWVNDCAGQSQVISCTDTERFLENITIDGGSF